MAVVRVAAIHHYTGLQADEKPTTGVPAGSRFFVIDTGLEYVFDGTDTWGQRVFPTDLPE